MKKIFTLVLGAMFTMSMNAEMILSVNGKGEVGSDPMQLQITEAEENPMTGEMTMELSGTILIEGSNLTVTITRTANDIEDEICCGQCYPGDGSMNEVKEFTISGPTDWYIHYTPKPQSDETITYTFSDGVSTKVIEVRFVYSATSISETSAEQKACPGVYSVFGQQLRSSNNTEGLPAGIYIVNGKKCIVR
ncbi:MAG: hypothetical protein MJZ82_00200 [Paludibacteraceae bacterium]|nr:hypothetical protein [Paludibacteraceae bacterium]